MNDQFVFNLARIPGIYTIINRKSQTLYIGESLDIKRRFGEHLSQLRDGTHANMTMRMDYKKYGEEAFEFKILQPHIAINTLQTKAELLILENAHINMYSKRYKIYNKADTMNEVLSTKLDVDSKKDIIIRKYIVDTLLSCDIEWIDNLPAIIKLTTIDDLLASNSTQQKLNHMLELMPDNFIGNAITVKKVQYFYNGKTNEKISLVVNDYEVVLSWLKEMKYKIDKNLNLINDPSDLRYTTSLISVKQI